MPISFKFFGFRFGGKSSKASISVAPGDTTPSAEFDSSVYADAGNLFLDAGKDAGKSGSPYYDADKLPTAKPEEHEYVYNEANVPPEETYDVPVMADTSIAGHMETKPGVGPPPLQPRTAFMAGATTYELMVPGSGPGRPPAQPEKGENPPAPPEEGKNPPPRPPRPTDTFIGVSDDETGALVRSGQDPNTVYSVPFEEEPPPLPPKRRASGTVEARLKGSDNAGGTTSKGPSNTPTTPGLGSSN